MNGKEIVYNEGGKRLLFSLVNEKHPVSLKCWRWILLFREDDFCNANQIGTFSTEHLAACAVVYTNAFVRVAFA